jgi:deazaflavin-dependent oxidoreductase (nitroreductase family)
MVDMNEFNKGIIDEFRKNKGKVGGPFENAHMLLLTTKGAKTGKTRVNPLAYLPDGKRYVIIASFAGAPNNPPWYHNLVANPDVSVEVGTEKVNVHATVLGEPDRTNLYKKMAAAMPPFAEYEKKTTRKIPVIALTRR